MSVRTAAALDAAAPTARILARRLAGASGEADDLQQDALLALHIALKRTTTPQYPITFSYAVMRRTMWRSWNRCPPGGRAVEAAPMPELAAPPEEHQLELDDFFTALERQCGTDARQVAEQLVHPTAAVAELLTAEVVRKQQARRGTVRMRREVLRQYVRRGLGLSRNQWRVIIRQVETFTRAWTAA